MRIYDLMKRKNNDGGAVYFCILPTINIINQHGNTFLYLAWLNICAVLKLSSNG